jgi:oligoribonuclease NrnB/cAMP/cGMP phosphodiesterase (DHH superfamily)
LENKLRLLTRSDFDGLVCATILKGIGIISEVSYVHPKDVQDKKIQVCGKDVIANLPYVAGCGLWFDHHSSEFERLHLKEGFNGTSEPAPSAARVIYEYYRKLWPYSQRLEKFEDLVITADIVDSAKFNEKDILDPQGWVMLAFITDPRSNFGKKRSFEVSNLELLKSLPDQLFSKTVDEILSMPDFAARVEAYKKDINKYRRSLLENTSIEGNAIIIDFRGIKKNPIGNRFLEYILFPKQNISIRIADGKDKQFALISVGHSIINRTSDVDVGSLMLKYGGGGHKRVGTCQIAYEDADEIIYKILQVVNNRNAIL